MMSNIGGVQTHNVLHNFCTLRKKISQQVRSLKVKCFFTCMSSGVTLITFFSLLMVGHFTPMGINSNDLLSPPMWGTSSHFLATNGGSLQVTLIFLALMGIISSDFFFHSNGGLLQRIFHFQVKSFDFSPFLVVRVII